MELDPRDNRFRIIVAGSRDFNDFRLLCAIMDKLLEQKKRTHQIIIVSGQASGADTLGEKYADLRGYTVDRRPARWDLHGKSAGYIRNVEMADNAHACVCFWDGKSKGTQHMINIATVKQLMLRVIRYNEVY